MKHTLLLSLAFVMACGGKSAPKKTEPDPDNRGIGQAETAQMACYEGCLEKGPDGANADWATKSDVDKQAACTESCKSAGAGLPSDQPAAQ